MSLINDALKRARQVKPTTPRTLDPEKSMKPVEQRNQALPPYFLPVCLVILAGASWFMLQAWKAKLQKDSQPPDSPVQARQATPATGPAVQQRSPFAAVPEFGVNEARHASNADARTSTPQIEPAPPGRIAAVERPDPAIFKLQGIFYRANDACAVINSRTVFLGDMVDNATVKAISQRSVTLEYEGRTKVLTLR
jgi:hypothetical protein